MEKEKIDVSVLTSFNPDENKERQVKTAEFDEASEEFAVKLGMKSEALHNLRKAIEAAKE